MSKVFIQNESGNILAKDDEPYMIDQVGTDVFVNGVRQDRLDFASDPQEQITANKLSDAQMQSIGEIDAIKGIALQNQTDLTTLASKVETNTTEIGKKSDGETQLINGITFYRTFDINSKGFFTIFGKVTIDFNYNGNQTKTISNAYNMNIVKDINNFLYFDYLDIATMTYKKETLTTDQTNNIQIKISSSRVGFLNTIKGV